MNKKGFYGRTMLVIIFLLYLCVLGFQAYGLGIVGKYMVEVKNITEAELGIMASIGGVSAGLVSFFASWMVKKRGIKFTLLSGTLLMILSCIVMSAMVNGSVGCYIWGGAVLGCGIGMASYVPCMTAITNWFEKKRSLAMAIFLLGGGIGGMVIPPVTNALIIRFGTWRAGWWFAASISIIAFIVSFFVVEKPSDIGQIPDGASYIQTAEKQNKNIQRQSNYEFSFREVLKCPGFYIIILATGSLNFFLGIIFMYNALHVTLSGFSTTVASIALSIFAFVSTVGRLIGGIAGNHVDNKHILIISLIFLAVGIVLGIRPVDSWIIYTYCALTGLGFGGSYVSSVVILSYYFGQIAYPDIVAMNNIIGFVFLSAAQLVTGIIFTITGNYAPAFIFAGVLVVVAAILAFTLKVPQITKTKK